LIKSSRTEYTWIYKKGGAVNISREGKSDTEKAIITNITDNSKIDNFINKFKQMKGLWNIENAEKWNQVNTKILEIILEELRLDNSILVDEYKTVAII